ncbi:MAG TPA: YDG domain-containing protein, partial [Hyphomicrobiaceae bacterium]|nr:YDG domain-containing protein [Hyphomicrobiaceae bacterium]
SIRNSYATGNVSGNDYVGGLVGDNSGLTENSYATGAVAGRDNVGGLAGLNGVQISNSYATGAVSGSTAVGGLVGLSGYSSAIGYSYATGSVSGTSSVGGLVGYDSLGTVTASFWDTDTSGQATSAGGTGLTTAQMKSLSTYTAAGWDIDDAGGTGKVWRIYEGDTYPLLRAFLTPLTIDSATNGGKTYDGVAVSSLPAGLFTISSAHDAGKVLFGGTLPGRKNAGSYTAAIYSDQAGYDLIGTRSAAYDITPKALSITGTTVAGKTYDGTTAATVTPGTLSGFVGSETVSVASASGTFADKNAGTGKSVTVAYTLADGTNGGLASNYSLANTTHSADITPRPVQVTAEAKSKLVGQSDPPLTYATACPTGMSADCGLVNGETLAGSLTRVAGEAVGSYAIKQGTVTDATNPNYAIDFVGADLSIAAVELTGAAGSALVSAQQVASGGQEGGTGGGSGAPISPAPNAPAPRLDTPGLPSIASSVRVEGSGIRLPEGSLSDD